MASLVESARIKSIVKEVAEMFMRSSAEALKYARELEIENEKKVNEWHACRKKEQRNQ